MAYAAASWTNGVWFSAENGVINSLHFAVRADDAHPRGILAPGRLVEVLGHRVARAVERRHVALAIRFAECRKCLLAILPAHHAVR